MNLTRLASNWLLTTLTFCLASGNLYASQEPLDKPLSAAELGDASPFTPVTFGDGIEFYVPESRFRMNLRFRMQNLADFNWREGAESPTHLNQEAVPPSQDFDWAVRRLRLRMNGTIASPKLQYLLQLSFSRADQDWDETQFPNVVRDAMVLYHLNDNWSLAFGQGKLPGNRQRVISSGDQQFVDRSLVNRFFNIDRDFGFQAQWAKEFATSVVRWQGSITSGMGRNRGVQPDNRLFYVSRFEWLPMGHFLRHGDYFESDLAFEPKPKASLGLSVAYLDGAARNNGAAGPFFFEMEDTRSPARRSPWVSYFDVLMKWRGHSFYGEWATRQLSQPIVNQQEAFFAGQGYNLQVGKMLDTKTEVTLRHSALLPWQSLENHHQRLRQWMVGFNYFINGHRVKLQGNLGRTEGIDHFARLQVELGI